MLYGRTVLGAQSVYPTSVLAALPGVWKAGGLTIDWATVTAVSGSDVTLTDGSVIKVGWKYLRYGQILTKITASGKYGPYDPAAVDGRATLTKGECFIVERTITNVNPLGFNSENNEIVSALEGGLLWKSRILMTSGSASLAAGPTVANFQSMFPIATYAQD